jgi:hypothetical protein
LGYCATSDSHREWPSREETPTCMNLYRKVEKHELLLVLRRSGGAEKRRDEAMLAREHGMDL